MAEMMKHIVYDEEERRMLPPDVPHLMHISDNEWMENGHLHLMHQHSDCFEVLLIHKERDCIHWAITSMKSVKETSYCATILRCMRKFPKTWQGISDALFAITNLCMPGLPSNHLIDERQCPVFISLDQFMISVH